MENKLNTERGGICKEKNKAGSGKGLITDGRDDFHFQTQQCKRFYGSVSFQSFCVESISLRLMGLERTSQALLLFHLFCHTRSQCSFCCPSASYCQQSTIFQKESEFLPDHKSVGSISLALLGSQTVRNKFSVVYKFPKIRHICHSSRNRLSQKTLLEIDALYFI